MRTILEIGGGTTPYFIRYDMPWLAGDAYICLDMNEKRVREAQAAVESAQKNGRPHPSEAEYVVHDATQLPFADSSVHEIVLSNVLSAPIHNTWNEKGTMVVMRNPSGVIERPIIGTKADGDLFYRERRPLIQEALRVLKPGGTLTIYTDLVIYGQHSYRRFLEELGRDRAIVAKLDTAEGERIDRLNKAKLAEEGRCYCLEAEVLPESSVHRFTKIL